jgi:hypothetical protein
MAFVRRMGVQVATCVTFVIGRIYLEIALKRGLYTVNLAGFESYLVLADL